MKTKNNLITGIIIGICMVVFPLILMSGTYLPNESGNENKFELTSVGGVGGVYMINKQTGETWYINGKNTKVKHKD
tara:strand:+ start:686 stop:913 length:228 start_codon:yes stop_codon:yes gene_type:complete